jgi:tryptophan-rich sensory protein
MSMNFPWNWFGGFAVFVLLYIPLGSSPMGAAQQQKYKLMKEKYQIPLMIPGWLFGPIWFTLYIFMTVALILWAEKQTSTVFTLDTDDTVVSSSSASLSSSLSNSLSDEHLSPMQKQAMWLSVLILFVINVLFNKLWPWLFWDVNKGNGMPVVAAIDAALIFLTATAIEVLFCVDTPISVLAIIFWGIYVVWSLFATILSIWIAVKSRQAGYELLEPVKP